MASRTDVAADDQSCPYEDGIVDSLLARQTFEHYIDTIALLAECRRAAWLVDLDRPRRGAVRRRDCRTRRNALPLLHRGAAFYGGR